MGQLFFFFILLLYVSSFTSNQLLDFLKFRCKLHHFTVQLSHCEQFTWSSLQNLLRIFAFQEIIACTMTVVGNRDYMQQLFLLPVLLECHCILCLGDNSSSYPENL